MVGVEQVLEPGATVTRTQPCPDGKIATGGGYKIDNPDNVVIYKSMPGNLTEVSDGVWHATGWEVKLRNDGDTKTNFVSFAHCAKLAG